MILDSVDTVTYLGHATTLLRLDGTPVLTDPVLRRQLGPLRREGPPVDLEVMPAPELVLVSHLHRDHLDLPSLRLLDTDTPVVVPRGAARLVARAGHSEIVELRTGESVTLAGVEVEATEARHDGHRDRWGAEIEPLGYVVARNGRRAYFAGDTELFDGMAALGPLDLALVPVAGWGPRLGPGHLDPDGAARSLQLLRPRVAIPIHWGTFYPLGLRRMIGNGLNEPPREFARRAAELAPEVEVRILEPGERWDLPAATRASVAGEAR